MKTLTFKTNIKCGGCIAQVTPYLNSDPAIKNWKVDTANQDKLLTVEGDTLTINQVTNLVAKAGFKAQAL